MNSFITLASDQNHKVLPLWLLMFPGAKTSSLTSSKGGTFTAQSLSSAHLLVPPTTGLSSLWFTNSVVLGKCVGEPAL